MKAMRLIRWSCLSLGIGLACFWLIYYQLKNEAMITVQDRTGYGTPQIGRDFTLIDQHSIQRSTSDFKGKYRLIYFGYSFCPDICPMGLQNMSEALTALGRDVDEVIPIFVTIDPERDTVENLKIYAGNFHPKFIMMTGTLAEITPILKDYKVYAVKARPDGTMADYLMDHSTLIYLMDRKGVFVKSFPHTIAGEALAKAITTILIEERKAL